MIKDNKILISEIFQSIDGEGYNAGYPTVFFRTIGCNLRCSWCDSTYTFLPDENSKFYSVQEALVEVLSYDIKHITITGGEPLLQVNKEWMTEFISRLLEERFIVDIETNGSISLEYWKTRFPSGVTFIMDWKAPASGMNKSMISENLKTLDYWDIIKIVVTDSDFEEVEKVLKSGTRADIYVSPAFNQVTMEKIPEFVLKHKEYENLRCQIQMHKIFWNPDKRGV